VLIPILSLALLIFSQWKHIQFKITLQRYLHGSLILMLAIAWFIEVGLVQRTDNRVDLMLTLCALGTQMALVAFAFVRINKQQKMLYRANNFL
jgi:branched-subunit amino acid ABC-type transport system permease component